MTRRDLRQTPLYREVEEFARRALEPAFGRISDAADPAPSPNGRFIAFTGSKLEKLEGVPITRICLADVEAGTFEEITAGPNGDRLPRWSPDGTSLAFLSDRAQQGRHQLYLLPPGRIGEAVAAPAVDGTVESLSWSPDGSQILLGVAGLGADLAGVQGSGSTKPNEPEDLPDWLPEVESGPDDSSWRRAWVFDVASNEVRPASREGLNVWEAAWCGPGRLAAIVADGPGEETWYEAPLALIDAESGKETILYRSEGRQLGVPAASADGRRLAVLEAICSDRLVIAGDVLLIDPETGGATRVETGGVDVTHVAWRDGHRLQFVGIRGMDAVAGILDANTGGVTEVWSSHENCGLVYPEAQPFGPSEAMAVVLQSYDRYPELALIEGGAPRTLVSFAHDGSRFVRSVDGRLERVAWTAPDGLEIEGLLARPEGDGPFPLITNVHGGPIAATLEKWAMRGLTTAFLVSRGYAVFFPNPRGSTGRGQAFAEMVYGDMGGADAQDDLAGIDALIERDRRPGTAGCDGRKLRRVHGRLAGDADRPVRRLGGRVTGHRLVQPAPHQQHRPLGPTDPEGRGRQPGRRILPAKPHRLRPPGEDPDAVDGRLGRPVHPSRPGPRALPGAARERRGDRAGRLPGRGPRGPKASRGARLDRQDRRVVRTVHARRCRLRRARRTRGLTRQLGHIERAPRAGVGRPPSDGAAAWSSMQLRC